MRQEQNIWEGFSNSFFALMLNIWQYYKARSLWNLQLNWVKFFVYEFCLTHINEQGLIQYDCSFNFGLWQKDKFIIRSSITSSELYSNDITSMKKLALTLCMKKGIIKKYSSETVVLNSFFDDYFRILLHKVVNIISQM